MSEYHEDSKCGACGGPLEACRDAICETCAPEEEWFGEFDPPSQAALRRMCRRLDGRAATIRRLDAEVRRLTATIQQLGILQVDYELGVRCAICGQAGLIPATIVHHPDCEAR